MLWGFKTMANLQRWMNFIHIKSLADILEAAPDGYSDTAGEEAYLERMVYHRGIRTITLTDGKPIAFDDPGIALFVSMIKFDPSDEQETLKDLLGNIKRTFRRELESPGMHGYQMPLLDELFELRKTPGGWAELDRLIEYIVDQSFTELVERNEGKVLFDPNDQGLGGQKCFAINFMMSDNTYSRYAGFASDAETIVGLIQPALDIIGGEHKNCRATPVAMIIVLNDKTQCMLPVVPITDTTIDMVSGGLHCHMDFSRMQPNWRTFSWHNHDIGLMKAVAAAAPEGERRRIKGEFLSDEMGL
jgi:hypothetical protein